MTSGESGVEDRPSNTAKDKDAASDSDGSDNGAEEILEESPCKRWSKRREKVKQRDVPGIDAAYLAMDNETGNEVVWNEVLFSERKNFRDQEEKLKAVFDNLTHLVHINLVKFHKYWTDTKSEKPRIIFITEYMSSGSMSRFLQRARSSKTSLNIKAWKKWTTQILSALNYLHSCDPPIVHGNLTCNTVFIQQNGLIKIGCVAPNAIHHHVKTFRENLRNMHYIAPEYEQGEVTPQADIYSFGICALEMALPMGLQGCLSNGESSTADKPITTHITVETIRKAVESLADPMQRDFIEKCLQREPKKRPTALDSKLIDYLNEDDFRIADPSKVAADSKNHSMTYRDLNSMVDLDKFLDDVRNGIYPLIAFAPLAHAPTRMNTSASLASMVSQDARSLTSKTGSTVSFDARPSSSRNLSSQADRGSGVSSQSSRALDTGGASSERAFNETRLIVKMEASITGSALKILLQLDDMMNRQLTTELGSSDTADTLVTELIHYGFISEKDSTNVKDLLNATLRKHREAKDRQTEAEATRKSSRTQQPEIIIEKPRQNSPSRNVSNNLAKQS